MVFKDTLKKLRAEHGVTQEELARYLGVSRPTIAGYETKSKEPDYDTLIRLSAYFDVSIDYLLTGKTFESPNTIEKKSKEELICEINSGLVLLSDTELLQLLDYETLLLRASGEACD